MISIGHIDQQITTLEETEFVKQLRILNELLKEMEGI